MMAAGEPGALLPVPAAIPGADAPPGGEMLDGLGLYPVRGEPDWAAGFGTQSTGVCAVAPVARPYEPA